MLIIIRVGIPRSDSDEFTSLIQLPRTWHPPVSLGFLLTEMSQN